MRALLSMTLFILTLACGNQPSEVTDISSRIVDASNTQGISLAPLPPVSERNIFVFQDDAGVTSDDIPWHNWKLLGTFTVDSQERHALLVSPEGVNFVFSTTSSLPEADWDISIIESNIITFISTDGLLYSIDSRSQR